MSDSVPGSFSILLIQPSIRSAPFSFLTADESNSWRHVQQKKEHVTLVQPYWPSAGHVTERHQLRLGVQLKSLADTLFLHLMSMSEFKAQSSASRFIKLATQSRLGVDC